MTEQSTPDYGDFRLKTGDVARIFGVNPKTVTRWAKENRITSRTLPSGHRRFSESEVEKIAKGRASL